ncbi:MAG: hypothetical protein R3E02_00820 [Blastomonas sp.]
MLKARSIVEQALHEAHRVLAQDGGSVDHLAIFLFATPNGKFVLSRSTDLKD